MPQFDAPEDATGQAGWMFSDMLIALMVVFLATITFIPQFSATGTLATSGGNQGSYAYTEHFDVALIRAYKTSDFKLISADILQFEKANGIPLDSVVDSAQFVGGYNQQSEKSADAIQRALTFSQQVDGLNPKIMEHASTILNSSSKLAIDLVTVRLTFSAKVNTK